MKKDPKELVALRSRRLKSGSESLYLEYTIDGERIRESLNLYLVPELTLYDREKNKATKRAAELLRSKRLISYELDREGIANVSTANKRRLIDTYEEFINGSRMSSTRKQAHSFVISHLKLYNENTRLKEVNRSWLLGFIDYLQNASAIKNTRNVKPLSQTTVSYYLASLSTMLKYTVRKGYLSKNPFSELEPREIPRKRPDEKTFLTLEEVRAIMNTPCKHEEIKEAFLFACFIGLRSSDIISLTWDMIDGDRIIKKIQKTQRQEYIPISENARRWLPKRIPGDPFVFHISKFASLRNSAIKKLAEDAGIKKKVTFHTARHTCATLLLTYGADIYTVSKILGHADISTTQIYAKIVDKKKEEAVNLIPKL